MKNSFTTLVLAAVLACPPLIVCSQSAGNNPADGKTGDTPAKEERKAESADSSKADKDAASKERPTLPELFTRLDTDNDGKLSKEEFMKLPRRMPANRADADKGRSRKDADDKKDDAEKKGDASKKNETGADKKEKDDKRSTSDGQPSGTGTTRGGRGANDGAQPPK